MAGPVVVVLIHGLPEPGLLPFDRLHEIEAAARQVTDTVRPLSWLNAIPMPLRRLARGEFASSLTPWLQEELTRSLADPAIGAEARFVVVAYSAGGLLFYRWIIDPTIPKAMKDRVALAVMLAAPYQCRDGQVELEYDERIVRVGERDLRPDELETIASSLAGRLHIFLGEQDRTTKPWDAYLPTDLCAIYGIAQESVPAATHLSLCATEQALDRVRSALEVLRSPH